MSPLFCGDEEKLSGLRRTEAKYGERETKMNRCEVKVAVEESESVDSSESSDLSSRISSIESRWIRTSAYSFDLHM